MTELMRASGGIIGIACVMGVLAGCSKTERTFTDTQTEGDAGGQSESDDDSSGLTDDDDETDGDDDEADDEPGPSGEGGGSGGDDDDDDGSAGIGAAGSDDPGAGGESAGGGTTNAAGAGGGSGASGIGGQSVGGGGGMMVAAGGVAGGETAGAGGGSSLPVDDTVSGRVINQWNHPVPNVTVMIGSEVTETDDDGEFEVSGVSATYEVFLDVRFHSWDDAVYGWVFQGLTRRDPTLQIYNALPLEYGRFTVTAMNFTAPVSGYTALAVGSDYGSELFWDGDWEETGVYWFGPEQAIMQFHGLQWEASADGLPTSYTGYTEAGPVVLDGTVTDYTPVPMDFTQSAVGSATISGTVTAETYVDRLNSVFVRFDTNAVILVADEVPDESNFSYTVPTIPGASLIFAAHEGWGYEEEARAVAWRTGVGPGTNIQVAVPAPATPTSPAAESTLADDTLFSWNSSASTFVWHLLADDYYEGVYVVTAEKQVTVPMFPNGLDVFREASEYLWRVETHSEFQSVDEMAGSSGYIRDYNWTSARYASGPTSVDGSFTSSEARFVNTP